MFSLTETGEFCFSSPFDLRGDDLIPTFMTLQRTVRTISVRGRLQWHAERKTRYSGRKCRHCSRVQRGRNKFKLEFEGSNPMAPHFKLAREPWNEIQISKNPSLRGKCGMRSYDSRFGSVGFSRNDEKCCRPARLQLTHAWTGASGGSRL